MEVLPAIDLLGGKVVRLLRGNYQEQTTYRDDPAAVVNEFAAIGARWVHVVDLDAARSGQLSNISAVQDICKTARTESIRVQFGGGVRGDAAIKILLSLGIDRLVIGSGALKDWQWFEGLLADDAYSNDLFALGLDARGGRLATEGWTEQRSETAMEIAARVTNSNLGAIVYTDIDRDGMLAGVNIAETNELISVTDVPIIASGGVRSIEDIRQCRHIGCQGVIIGKAYYEGKIDLERAIVEANKKTN